MDDIVLKIDSIELKFKNEDGKIESLDEFSSNLDQGFYLDVHSVLVLIARMSYGDII